MQIISNTCMILPIFVTLLLSLVSYTFATKGANSIDFDFCVADTSVPHGPTGYACKDPSTVTAKDFMFSGLRKPGNTSTMFKTSVSEAFVKDIPALNGMGISIIRVEVAVGGTVPLHTHRVVELIIVIDGTVGAGFVDTNSTAYYNVLHKGDIMIVPPTLVHFQANIGKVPAVMYTCFTSPNPGKLQPLSAAIFETDLPTEIIQRITLLDHSQIKKLKKVFGGTN